MIRKRRQLNGVLAGFLGTYTSRYSDFEGYWLFGFIVETIDLLEINLLAKPSAAAGAIARAENLARTKFREQLRKHGFAESAAAISMGTFLTLAVTHVARLLVGRREGSG